MTPFDIVLWQNSLSIHQAPFVKALQDHGLKVLVVAEVGISAARASLGWSAIDYGAAEVVTAPGEGELESILQRVKSPGTAHIFSGIDSYPLVTRARRSVVEQPHGHIFVASEPWDPRGARGLLRAAKYKRRLRQLHHVDTLLCIGSLARTQFSSLPGLGMRLSDFAYFVEAAPGVPLGPSRQERDNRVKFLFTGSLDSRKRPDHLLSRLLELNSPHWTLDVVGNGPLHDDVKRSASPHGDRVRVWGALPHAEIADRMSHADVLVLPSAHDGWGAVVSEALGAGTRVVVSNAAGASDLVTEERAGTVYDHRIAKALPAALEGAIAAGPQTSDRRAALRAWSDERFSARVGAAYVMRLLEEPHAAVEAPWRERR